MALRYHLKIDFTDAGDLAAKHYDKLVSIGKTIDIISSSLKGEIVLSDLAESYRKPMIYFDNQTGTQKTEDWKNTYGYVLTKHPGTPQKVKKSIHIRFSRVENGHKVKTAQHIIHEASHKFADTRDEAYGFEPGYANLDVVKSTRNADSIAYYIVCLAQQEFIDYDSLSKKYSLAPPSFF
jgi:hypothetical protein